MAEVPSGFDAPPLYVSRAFSISSSLKKTWHVLNSFLIKGNHITISMIFDPLPRLNDHGLGSVHQSHRLQLILAGGRCGSGMSFEPTKLSPSFNAKILQLVRRLNSQIPPGRSNGSAYKRCNLDMGRCKTRTLLRNTLLLCTTELLELQGVSVAPGAILLAEVSRLILCFQENAPREGA